MQPERWLYPDLSRLLMVLGVGFLSLSVLTGFLIRRIRGSFKAFSKSTIFYTLAYTIFFALSGFCIALPWFNQYASFYILLQALCLGAGILHLFAMRRWLKWTGPGAFWPELLHLVIITLLGGIAMVLTYRLVNREGLEIAMATASFFFSIPYFIYQTYLRATDMPPRIFRKWYYPIQHNEVLFDETKLRNLLVISFEFQKQPADRYFTNFRAKAPVDMEFGELFYYFINDYNERHTQSPIHYINQTGDADSWVFYKKPKWYTIFTQYIDTEKTIFINNIHENEVIICSRIV